ncbi:MAG: hypothetical protein AAFZ52_13595 [Bacteroidota bacterium]
MRGLKASQEIRRLDSIVGFTPEGERIPNYSPAYRAKPVPRPNPTAQVTQLEGRIGMVIERQLAAPGITPEMIKTCTDQPEVIRLREGADGKIKVKARIPGGHTTHKLRFPEGKEATVFLKGFHLNESDFRREWDFPLAAYWQAEGQPILYLRLRSTEKLMLVYRDEKLLGRLPVGRQIDEVPVGNWKEGDYLLEIRDLGTGERRYHGIRL